MGGLLEAEEQDRELRMWMQREAADEDSHVGDGDTDSTDYSLPGYGSVMELYGVQRRSILTWAS